jgi:hypothetical protein
MARSLEAIFGELSQLTGVSQEVIDGAFTKIVKANPTTLIKSDGLVDGQYEVATDRAGGIAKSVRIEVTPVSLQNSVNTKPLAGALRILYFTVVQGKVQDVSVKTLKPGAGRKPASQASK